MYGYWFLKIIHKKIKYTHQEFGIVRNVKYVGLLNDFAVVETHKENQTPDNANFTNLPLLVLVLLILVVFNGI